jgi:hypothetical protein
MPNSPELEKIMQMAEESDYHWTLKPLTDLYLAGGVPEPQLYDKEKHRGYEVDHELMEAARHQFPEDEAFAGHLADQPIGRVEHFTDTYMDLQGGSPLLDEGVSVRKRSTMKGTKLNVKTGPGKPISDVTFRRHELGMHMRPGATAPQIGRYLEAGHARAGDGEVIDPWNRMAFEAERAARFGEGELDFAKLREVLVLQGKRHKFALSGTPGPGCAGTPINIEISCDHTVGQLAADFDPKAAAGWNSDSQKLKHIFNIEMELEHLPFNGGGETAAPAMPEEEPQGKGKEKEKEKESGGAPPAEATDDERPVPPPGHPGRYYLNADTDSAAWKTPAFERFEHIHGAVLGYLREQIKGDKKELGPDEQKVTNLFDALGKPQAK